MTEAAKVIEGEVEPPKRNGKRKNEVTKVEEASPPAAAGDLISIIERMALNPSVNVETIERMMAMRERMEAQQNEREFNAKMALAQAEMRPVAADASNPQTKSKYASYPALDRALRPVYTKVGFALSFNTDPGAPENYVRVLCDVTNCGHTRRYQIDMPADGKGAKGGDVMTKTHATGSAVSYGMRYLLKMVFNIAVGEADDDGNAAGTGATITEAQAAQIQSAIVDTGSDIQRFCRYFKIESVGALPAKRFDEALSMLDAKKRSQI